MTRTNLGCVGCPCASKCATRPGLSGLGCPCNGCAKSGACKGGQLGFTFPTSSVEIDFTDVKTWIIAALAALVVYQLLFTKDKRVKRTKRRQAFAAERQRYQTAMRRIREETA